MKPLWAQRSKAEKVISILEDAAGRPDQDDRAKARLLDIAAWVRKTGRPTAKILRVAAYYVSVCDICGKKALYRMGLYGRCRAHRDITTAGVLKARQILEETHSARNAEIAEYERGRRVSERLQSAFGATARPPAMGGRR